MQRPPQIKTSALRDVLSLLASVSLGPYISSQGRKSPTCRVERPHFQQRYLSFHSHIESAIGQRDILGVAVDERKGEAEFLLESGVVHRALNPGTLRSADGAL